MNFKAIQKKYPDALQLKLQLKRGAEPLSQEVMARIIGGGKVLAFTTSNSSQMIVCSKQAANEEEVTNG